MKVLPLKRLFIVLLACLAAVLSYAKLRNHPQVEAKVAEVQRRSRVFLDKSGEAAQSAKDQAESAAGDLAGTASTGAHELVSATGTKARDAIETAAETWRHVIEPVHEKIQSLHRDASMPRTEASGGDNTDD